MTLTPYQISVLKTRMKAECISHTLYYIAGAVLCCILGMEPGQVVGTFICFAGAIWNLYLALTNKILRGEKNHDHVLQSGSEE